MPFQTIRLLPLAALAVIACSSTKSSPSTSAAAPPATSQDTSTAASAVVIAAPPVASPALVAEIRKGIVQRGPSSFVIARSTMAQIIDNQPALMSQSRVVPETDQGKPIGFRMFGVTPDSTLGTLGIKNGDRVERIDGTDLSSDEALATYASLRTVDHFTLVLNRAGQDITLDYDVK